MYARSKRNIGRRRGVTLVELMIAGGVMAILAYGVSTIYFSTLHIYNQYIWHLPPYDAATAAVQRLSRELREGMLIESHGTAFMSIIMPQKGANGDNVLTLGADGYYLTQGDRVAFYLSNNTGALEAQGNCLWKAVEPRGTVGLVPRAKIADNIHPELNPTDPDTGQPRPVFKYWPDDIRLWGVEMWVTSTATVHGQARTQTAHSECYLRNL